MAEAYWRYSDSRQQASATLQLPVAKRLRSDYGINNIFHRLFPILPVFVDFFSKLGFWGLFCLGITCRITVFCKSSKTKKEKKAIFDFFRVNAKDGS